MTIYSGLPLGEKIGKARSRGLGVMISATDSPSGWIDDKIEGMPLALDNGAYVAHKKGLPFSPHRFLKTLDHCVAKDFDLDFVVAPDAVGRGRRSLEMSIHWAEKMIPGPNLALAVQDGMKPEHITGGGITDLFSTLFVGGTVGWKWRTAATWVETAHALGMPCHIGQVGRLPWLRHAQHIGADSVDSVSFVRNDSWHIVDEFNQPRPTQPSLDLFHTSPQPFCE